VTMAAAIASHHVSAPVGSENAKSLSRSSLQLGDTADAGTARKIP